MLVQLMIWKIISSLRSSTLWNFLRKTITFKINLLISLIKLNIPKNNYGQRIAELFLLFRGWEGEWGGGGLIANFVMKNQIFHPLFIPSKKLNFGRTLAPSRPSIHLWWSVKYILLNRVFYFGVMAGLSKKLCILPKPCKLLSVFAVLK